MALLGNRFHKFFSPVLGTGAALAFFTLGTTAEAAEKVTQSRLERLSRGINASHWFAQVFSKEGYSAEHFRNYFTRTDAAFIRKAGLRHVRLSLEPQGLFRPEEPRTLDPMRLFELDLAIRMLQENDLAVIVDIHTFGPFLDKLKEDDAHLAAVAEFWGALAGHLSAYNPEMLFLELLNEPQVSRQERWQHIVRTLATAARKGAPAHTLIVSGREWSNIPDLLALEPLDDPNIVYNFHFYEPGVFTHQGASWSYPPWAKVKHVPYPVTPEILKNSRAEALDEPGRKALEHYAKERWNAARIEARIAKAAEWGRKHDVPLICNEFGVYVKFAPEPDRLRYLADTRRALEKHRIGWTMWDYAENFRLVKSRRNGRIQFDDGLDKALGLKK